MTMNDELTPDLESLRMTSKEEAVVILDDVFDGDLIAKETCLRQLAEANSLSYDEMTPEDIDEMVIVHEDALYQLSDDYNAG